MISKKKLISVAAAIAISSVNVSADYLPLTSGTTENEWVMFGVTGFHANGATDGVSAAGAVDAGMFSVTDDTDNLAQDTGGDELYGYEEGVSATTDDAITDATGVLASVKRLDGVASAVYVRVSVADNADMTFSETDPIRTIYVKKEADDTTSLFAFSYKSILEGQKLEFSTTLSGATDEAYRITINSENTYNNPAIGEFIPAIVDSGAEDGDSGSYLASVSDAVDYDFEDGPEEINPLNSAKYLKVDHKDVAASGESIRLYSYDPGSSWLLYDSQNFQQQFDTLEKGKGYWGKMDLAAATPAGLVLGAPSITPQDYIDAGVAAGWNLLAFNADNADLRTATTGLVITTAAADITLSDVTGNHSVDVTLAGAVATTNSLQINNAIQQAKIDGLIPKTFNLIAIPTGVATVALISDKQFTLASSVPAMEDTAVTLAGKDPLAAATLIAHADADGDVISKYGEYALVVKPENDGWAEFDIKCNTKTTELVAPTTAGIVGATCIDATYDLDLSYDVAVTAKEGILIASDEAFEIRDHTFSRVYSYETAEGDGELTFVNADATITGTATITGGVKEVFTADFSVVDDGDSIAFDGVTYTAAAGDGATATNAAAAFVAVHKGNGTNWESSSSGATVTFTAKAIGVVVDTTYNNADAGGGVNGWTITSAGGFAETVTVTAAVTDGVDATADAGAVITLLDGVNGLTDTENMVQAGTEEKIIFRMKEAGSNEFRVLETGDADNLTPTTTTNVLAKGAISEVYSPNALVKAALENTVDVVFTDDATGDDDLAVGDTVQIDVDTAVQTISLDAYTVVAADEADADVFYVNFMAHLNTQLDAKNIDTTVTRADTAALLVFTETLTFTGSDITDVSAIVITTATDTTAAATATLGYPNFGSGDITADLKYNFVLSPNYVLDGPLYDIKAAGYSAKAMVTGTTDLGTGSMNWVSIDLTRKPSEWLDSQDYNLFSVDNAAGYWTYLAEEPENPLGFDTATFTANHSQHFDQDGTTYNQVAGGINVNVTGIDYSFDGTESARVVAIVGGSQIELSRQAGDTYTGQISSRELAEMTEGKEYDIQVVVADGIGNRIPATSTEVVVDFKKPAIPAVTLTGGTMEITNDEADGVTQYYVFNDDIPATSTANAAIANMTTAEAASYNFCGDLSRTSTYDLKIVALDGGMLSTSNVSDAYTIDNYVPLFKNSAILTDSMSTFDTDLSLATVYYNSTCADTDITTIDTTKVVAASYTNNETVKVAYEPIVAGSGTPLSVFVDGGALTNTVALLTYEPTYVGKVVFVQLGDLLYRYEFPAATDIPAANSELNPIDMSAAGTYLQGQNLGE